MKVFFCTEYILAIFGSLVGLTSTVTIVLNTLFLGIWESREKERKIEKSESSSVIRNFIDFYFIS